MRNDTVMRYITSAKEVTSDVRKIFDLRTSETTKRSNKGTILQTTNNPPKEQLSVKYDSSS